SYTVCLSLGDVAFVCCCFCGTTTSANYTVSLHDALPISGADQQAVHEPDERVPAVDEATAETTGVHGARVTRAAQRDDDRRELRSEEHTSELQSRENLVCRLLPEKKKNCVNT